LTLINSVLKGRKPYSKIYDTISELTDKFIKKFKRKPSEKELSKLLKDINLKLNSALQEKTTSLFKDTYLATQNQVSRQLNVKIGFDVLDQNALIALSSQEVLSQSFSGIAEDLTSSIQDIITQAYHTPKGMSFANMQKEIQATTNLTDFRAETIARTEAGKIASSARKNSYSKQSGFAEFKFKWIGPNDSRTTGTSKRIKKRVGNGVTYTELVRIVTEESAKDFPKWKVDPNALMSHYNSRHIFIKV